MHRVISYTIIVCAVGHILLLWLPDKTIWHYLDTDMPHYMWVGLGAFGALLATIFLALPQFRRYWHTRYRQFRNWHYVLSLAIILLSVWHVIGSGFYFSVSESWLLAVYAGAFVLMHKSNVKLNPDLSNSILAATLMIPVTWLIIRLI
jgi:hypothetical protein